MADGNPFGPGLLRFLRALERRNERAVEHQGVEVQVQVERVAEALHEEPTEFPLHETGDVAPALADAVQEGLEVARDDAVQRRLLRPAGQVDAPAALRSSHRPLRVPEASLDLEGAPGRS